MLSPNYPQDPKDVLRGSFRDLCDPAWWRALHLDGLVLYSWAAPEYSAVAKAVHQAGVRALIYMDTCGLVSRLGSSKAWWTYGWRPVWARANGSILAGLFFLAKFSIDSVFLVTARRRIQHLIWGFAVTLPTRLGVVWMKKEVSRLGRGDLAENIFYSPHPQKQIFTYKAQSKENIIICVARFLSEDWAQKRPALLIKSLNLFLADNRDWQAVVVGRGATRLVDALGIPANPSIRFEENLAHPDLVQLYQRAKIGFWTSLWEGQQGTGAQALCCGCSVVAPQSPLNSCFADYVSACSGRLALDSSVSSLTAALALEVEDWEKGLRCPESISLFWRSLFHGDARAREVVRLLQLTAPENNLRPKAFVS